MSTSLILGAKYQQPQTDYIKGSLPAIWRCYSVHGVHNLSFTCEIDIIRECKSHVLSEIPSIHYATFKLLMHLMHERKYKSV